MYSRTRRSTVSSEDPASGFDGIDSKPAGLLRTMMLSSSWRISNDARARDCAGRLMFSSIAARVHVEAGIVFDPAIDGDLSFFNRIADLPPGER